MVMIVKMATMRKMVRIVPALEQRGLVWRQVLQIFLRSGRILSLIMIVVSACVVDAVGSWLAMSQWCFPWRCHLMVGRIGRRMTFR